MKIESMWGDLEDLPDFKQFEFMVHDYDKKHPHYTYKNFDMNTFKDCRITFEINMEGAYKPLEWEVRKFLDVDLSEHMI